MPGAGAYYPTSTNTAWDYGYQPVSTGAWPHYAVPANASYTQPTMYYPAPQAWPAYWSYPMYPYYR